MVPHRGRPLVVVVLKHRAAGRPRLAERPLRLRLEPAVVRSSPRVARRDVARMGQVPGLGEAVELLAAVSAVEVRHDRHRPRVGRVVAAVPVATAGASGRVGPVKRLVDRQQVRSELAVWLDQLVYPLDPHWLAPPRLDRESRVVERSGVIHRAVAPDRGRLQPHARRQDLLAELAHADPVVVDAPALPSVRLAAARHRRRDHQRRDVLRDRGGSSSARRGRLRPSPAADEAPHQQPRAGADPVLDEPAPGDPRSRYVAGALPSILRLSHLLHLPDPSVLRSGARGRSSTCGRAARQPRSQAASDDHRRGPNWDFARRKRWPISVGAYPGEVTSREIPLRRESTKSCSIPRSSAERSRSISSLVWRSISRSQPIRRCRSLSAASALLKLGSIRAAAGSGARSGAIRRRHS